MSDQQNNPNHRTFTRADRGLSYFGEGVRIDDALKYVAAKLKWEKECALGSINDSMCDADHEGEIDAISYAIERVVELAERLTDPGRYSDGRVVVSRTEIEHGIYTSHIWHPDARKEEPDTWSGTLTHDPSTPCPGFFTVTTEPVSQNIDVKVFRDVSVSHITSAPSWPK